MPRLGKSALIGAFVLTICAPAAKALPAEVQSAIDEYFFAKKSGAADAAQQLAEAKHDVDELEARILPALVALNRAAPLIAKRTADIDALEKYMNAAITKSSNPYVDAAWAGQARSQAMAVCCSVRAVPLLMREVQDNLVNGLPPLSAESLAKIAEVAKNVTIKSHPSGGTQGDEIVPSRPFVSRPKEEDGRRRRGGDERGIISGLPDLQPDPPPKKEEPPPKPPSPPAPTVSP